MVSALNAAPELLGHDEWQSLLHAATLTENARAALLALATELHSAHQAFNTTPHLRRTKCDAVAIQRDVEATRKEAIKALRELHYAAAEVRLGIHQLRDWEYADNAEHFATMLAFRVELGVVTYGEIEERRGHLDWLDDLRKNYVGAAEELSR